MAEHYYRLVHRAIREADPEALIFGDRLQIYYDPDAIRPMTPYLDVVATNYDVDGQDGSIARYYFDGLRQLTNNKPVLISEWFFAAHENRSGNLNKGHLMTVQTQAERARGAAAAAQWFAKIHTLLGFTGSNTMIIRWEDVLMARITTLAWWTSMTVRMRQ